jgi:DNA-binding beta-propeller fold protein YncE
LLIICVLGLSCSSAFVQESPKPGIMTTVVGTGKKGYAGDGGPASKALLDQPFHCEVDGKGNLYIAEAGNHCIRKVNLKTGVITTVAGTGKKGYTGDGGSATEATFNEPYSVVVDPDDNLYVTDRLNAVVRKVDGRTGIISTVAGTGKKGYAGDGGPGTKAQLREPNDAVLHVGGGLLIADVADWRVRRLDLGNGIIGLYAGKGKADIPLKKVIDRTRTGDGGLPDMATIVGARAVSYDGKNVYICEREGSAVRKVAADGTITTIAGTGEWGYSGDGGDARRAVFAGPKGIRCDAAGPIYVVDCENHSIRKIDAKTNVVTTVAGGRKGPGGDSGPATEAGMDRPHGCCIDADGNLYIADTNNHRVRMVRLK